MIMKKYIITFAALALFVACAQENEMEQSRMVFINAEANETKTLLDGNAVVWEANDNVALRFTSSSETYVVPFSTTQSGETVTFSGSIDNDVTVAGGYAASGYAVYPAAAMNTAGEVSFSLPATVTALENGSFASGTNLSSAVVSLADLNESGTADAVFLNAFSIIRFTVPANVKSVEITTDRNIAGEATMKFDSDGRLCAENWTSEVQTIKVLPEGATFTAGKTYNVLIYPGTFTTLAVKLTDDDGCVYEKSITGSYNFEPATFNTFNFNTKYLKDFQFTASGRNFVTGDKIMTVYSVGGSVVFEDELTASGSVFAGQLPQSVVHPTGAVTGFAVYPSDAYNQGTDKITYELASTGTPADLYSAKLTVSGTTATFNSVANAVSKLTFTLPAGIQSVTVKSSKNFTGTAEMSVDANGKLVAGTPSSDEIEFTAGGTAGAYTLNIYPVSGADLTFTLKDSADASVTQTFSNKTVAAGGTLSISLDGDIEFNKNGSFKNDDFANGGNYEF